MIVAPGSTSQIVTIQIVDDSGLPVTGLASGTFPAVYYTLGANTASVQITPLSDLALITTAFTAKGVKERENGYYRIDVPDAAWASAGTVKIQGEATGKRVICEPVVVANLPANAVQIGGVGQTGRDLGASVLLAPGTGAGQVTLASGILTANANGDFTATQKTSAQTAADAAVTANTAIGAIETHVGNIDTQVGTAGAGLTVVLGKLPTALSSNGNMKSDIEELAGNIGGAARLDRSARAITLGTVGSASSTTSIVTSSLVPAAAVTDQFVGCIVSFDKDTTTAALRGQKTSITASTSGGVLTVTPLTTAPVSSDTFTIT